MNPVMCARLVFGACILSGCQTVSQGMIDANKVGSPDFVPYTTIPVQHSFFVSYFDNQFKQQSKPWPTTNAEVRALLPNLLSEIVIESNDASGH